ncbi:DUF1573 domain-containing protein [Polaribacter vadi]|uniref:DUF1573 domain-containing protein n=1 Tax=Polaribacter TaxID=52959 RepID=UPI001C08A5AF|nr:MULTISPECIES: DUF1573 domain-containing protein [Polaribacter]MBU3009987.1 DUF1573 domain-containing protein [Polaribacter vadi]MDO6739794.1 DUF1573 domain-containing protein [Polaribacter sp. 1_MG-2023]
MKNLLLLLVLALTISSCSFRKPDIENVRKTKMEIENPDRHYYPILRGSELSAEYKFYNRGNEPLIIYDVQASCGCIEIDFPSTSIGKDDFGYITLDYDSAKNIGYVEFYVTIVANTEKDVFTTIKFDLNVVTSPHYTQDYEEIYLERRKEKLAGEVDGDLTQQGYYIDDEKTVR